MKMFVDKSMLEQALEALEIGWSTTHTGKDARELGMKAITALRAALAQEQTEPEPMAWMWRCRSYCNWPEWSVSLRRPADSGRDGNKRTEGYEDVPLYAALAQQAEPVQKPVARECSDPMCACRGGPCAECEEGQREKEIEDLRFSLDFYQRRCEALQSWQSKMRDPERTIVCDILANGFTLDSAFAGDRYTSKPLTGEPVKFWPLAPKSGYYDVNSKRMWLEKDDPFPEPTRTVQRKNDVRD